VRSSGGGSRKHGSYRILKDRSSGGWAALDNKHGGLILFSQEDQICQPGGCPSTRQAFVIEGILQRLRAETEEPWDGTWRMLVLDAEKTAASGSKCVRHCGSKAGA
jgi:hypothetical protein